MTIRPQVVLAALLILSPVSCTQPPEEAAAPQDAHGESLGSVHFPVDCDAAAAATVERGVALLHHMTYESARKVFQEATEQDPECALAYWGMAMTYVHPLWSDRPTPETLARATELTTRARSLAGDSARARAYIDAVGAYVEGTEDLSEGERLERFEVAWKTVHEVAPDDVEAKAFYALAHMALADPGDKTYERQRAAGAIAEEVLAQVPDHPGGHHYVIHAYDYPPLAEKALPVARNYGKIAPEVPHALHMTSHIFTRRGLWDESIEWNVRSAAAALRMSEDLGSIVLHYQHALDYLAYAYLQKAMDAEALDVVEKAAALEPPFHPVNRNAAAHALVAVPARYAVERQDWKAAAALEPRVPSSFPWEEVHDQFVVNTHFARALGLAHEGRFDEAAKEVALIEAIRDTVEPRSPYWAKQAEVQRLAAQAWLRYLSGETTEGLGLMEESADLQATTEKAPVTPGEVLPSAELLGDMLLAQERYEDAIAAYDVALARSPERFNSLYGAGRAAEALGDAERAREYYGRLVEWTRNSTAERPRVAHAREFLGS